MKTFLNCTMPALVNISVGSLRGTSGEEAHDLVALAGEVVEEGGADVVEARHRVPSEADRGSRSRPQRLAAEAAVFIAAVIAAADGRPESKRLIALSISVWQVF